MYFIANKYENLDMMWLCASDANEIDGDPYFWTSWETLVLCSANGCNNKHHRYAFHDIGSALRTTKKVIKRSPSDPKNIYLYDTKTQTAQRLDNLW